MVKWKGWMRRPEEDSQSYSSARESLKGVQIQMCPSWPDKGLEIEEG